MTAPRQVLPGVSYLVTRRCFQRMFLLRPSPATNAIFLYVLAVAARRYGILVHAFCVMSNHFHLVVTDVDARLPEFEQYLNALVARAVNASLGRWESFWAPGSYSAVVLASPQDVVEKAAYVLTNPVKAGLVASAQAWPGLWSAPESIGAGALRAARPERFFRRSGPMPEEAQVALVPPPGFESAETFRAQLVDAIAAREHEIADAHARSGTGFLGARRVLAQRPTGRPPVSAPMRGLRPRVAARDPWKRIEALGRLAGFLRAYREAWRARRAGRADAVFPAGTYLLRVAHGVPCAGVG
ncbi:transposase [Anaeromyxobacter sp. Red801]|uniref:transposase n=1 Tax=Anaeromyxobacter sp. Red801 TaxID=3411632 RepID=UPI003B9DE92A